MRALPLVLGLLFLCAADVGAGGRSVADHLERMASAMRTLSYEGVLVYLHDSRLETLRIAHRVDGGRVHEVLESLTGPVRTVTRGPDEVRCDLSDAHPISVRRPGLGGGLFRSAAIDPDSLAPHYLIHPLGFARVAGRQTEVLGIIPRDRLRYGYRFYLDEETGLPLKTDLMGTEAEPLEQIMFTSLTLAEDSLPDDAVAPANGADGEAQATPAAQERWQFESLPAGFELVMRDRASDPGGSGTEHFVLSDGLASVSVYVENGVEDGLNGDSRMGAIHAAGVRFGDYQITVVGEVPAETVRAVLAAISYRGDGS
jgi:sigma-E factor negative regulatory protein RseB